MKFFFNDSLKEEGKLYSCNVLTTKIAENLCFRGFLSFPPVCLAVYSFNLLSQYSVLRHSWSMPSLVPICKRLVRIPQVLQKFVTLKHEILFLVQTMRCTCVNCCRMARCTYALYGKYRYGTLRTGLLHPFLTYGRNATLIVL